MVKKTTEPRTLAEYPAYATAKAKADVLAERLANLETAIRDELDRRAANPASEAVVKGLLDDPGASFATLTSSGIDLEAMRREHAAVAKAAELAGMEASTAHMEASRAICNACGAEHAACVEAIRNAIDTLDRALMAERGVRGDLERDGVAICWPIHPVSLMPWDQWCAIRDGWRRDNPR